MGEGMTAAIVRYDRHGRPEYAKSPATIRALAILQSSIDRSAKEERDKQKSRQDAEKLTMNERVLKSIFGEIK